MSGSVFVSYRKSDDPGNAGRVRDALVNRFGEDHVFFDVESIRGGQRWEEALDSSLTASEVVVLVVGPRWAQILEDRAQQPEIDYHLREITMALERDVPIHPVLVQGAAIPAGDQLPDELRTALHGIQWTPLHEDMFGPCMAKVIKAIEPVVDPDGAGRASRPSAPDDAARREVTVGPRGSDADYQEISDAVAAVADKGRVLVRPGRYLKPVVIDRSLSIVKDGKGEVLLDSDVVPCLRVMAEQVHVQGLRIKSSAASGAVCIQVDEGDAVFEEVRVDAQWVAGSIGFSIVGATARPMLVDCSISSVAVGINISDGAGPRIERTTVAKAADHAVAISTEADPKISGCSFAGAGSSTVLVQEAGRGSFDDCAIGTGGGATIEIRSGAMPNIQGSRANAAPTNTLAKLPDRVAKVRSGALVASDDKDRGGWSLLVVDGGNGTVTGADLASVRTSTGGDPRVVDSAVTVVTCDDIGLGTFERSAIGRVILATGADPTFRDRCTIDPEKGVKITVDVGMAAAGTFEDCEIIGRNVRDGSADPAVRSAGGSPTLRRCTIKNAGEGALWVTGGGTATVEGGELRCSVSGPSVVVEDGEATLEGVTIGSGLRVCGGGRLSITGGEVGADPVSGAVVEVMADGVLTLDGARVKGPGLAAVRKVGKWIESKVGKGSGVLGATPPVRIADSATVSLRNATLTGLDPESLKGAKVTAEGCTLDGSPLP